MARRTPNLARNAARARKKAGKSGITPKPRRAITVKPPEADPATKRFLSDLMVREEAAKLTKGGKLPLHATHVITQDNIDGTVKVERARFKTF